MRWSELIRMAGRNLVGRWGRTSLNLLGVIVGCTTLLLTAACGGGVRDTFYLMFDSSPEARRIVVSPPFVSSNYVSWKKAPEEALQTPEGLSASRRERIRKELAIEWASKENGKRPPTKRKLLTLESVSEFQEIDHVQFVIPVTAIACELPGKVKPLEVAIGYGGHLTGAFEQIVAGAAVDESDTDGVIIHEYLAYRLGFRTDKQLQQLVGKPLSFTYETNCDAIHQSPVFSRLRWFFSDRSEQTTFVEGFALILQNLDRFGLSEKQRELIERLMPSSSEAVAPPTVTRKEREFIVRGIFHNTEGEKSWDMFESYLRANTLVRASSAAVVAMSRQQFDTPKFNDVAVVVDSTKNLDSVVQELKNRRLNTVSARRVLERVDKEIDRITTIVYWVAGGILFLTVLGISNTLFISVLQRTPEFGIMKSLGASDGDVLCLTLFEGMICGLLGAVIAVVVSFGLAAIGKSLLARYVIDSMHRQMDFDVVISLSPAVIAATIAGSIIVCGIASLLPAWRAARLDPVEAMRRT